MSNFLTKYEKQNVLDHSTGSVDAALIAGWKERVDDQWAELCELVDTRTLLLKASYNRHKFFADAVDLIERISV